MATAQATVVVRNSILLHIITVTLSHTNLHFTHTVTLVHARRPHVLCMSWSVHRLCRYIRQVVISLYSSSLELSFIILISSL